MAGKKKKSFKDALEEYRRKRGKGKGDKDSHESMHNDDKESDDKKKSRY